MIFRFDPEKHEYFYGERKVPSVTGIITNVYGEPKISGKKSKTFYLDRGKALHLAIHYWNKNILDVESLDDEIKARMNAFYRFSRENNVVVDFGEPKISGLDRYSELALYSKRHAFAGTIDNILNMVLIDYKSSFYASALIQLGGYMLLLEENGISINGATAVELKENGLYKYHPIRHKFDYGSFKKHRRHWQNAFLNTLSVYNLKKEHNI